VFTPPETESQLLGFSYSVNSDQLTVNSFFAHAFKPVTTNLEPVTEYMFKTTTSS